MARRKKKTLSKLKEYKFSNINFRLLLYVVCLTVIGILAIGSATSGGTEQKKQILGFVMGIIILKENRTIILCSILPVIYILIRM